MTVQPSLLHRDLTGRIIRTFHAVHHETGCCLPEAAHEAGMCIALRSEGLTVDRQRVMPIQFRGLVIGELRTDLIVEESVVVEVKAAKAIEPAHEAQLLTYLRGTNLEVGLLLNFGPRAEFRRFIFTNDRKPGVRVLRPPERAMVER